MTEHRHLPHLRPFAPHPIIFLTVVTHRRRRCLACQSAFERLATIWQQSPRCDGWFVGDYLLLPDHIHLMARAAVDAKPLAQWVETWKSLSSRRLKARTGLAPPLWQRDYFDRFLRSAENYSEKWHSITMNPVRKKLCAEPDSWPWKGRMHDLMF